MITIDALGKPCPIPVIETKKIFKNHPGESVITLVDNFAAVENLKKMALGYGYIFSYSERSKNFYEVKIDITAGGSDENQSKQTAAAQLTQDEFANISDVTSSDVAVVIGKNSMGSGAEELGRILIKGFIYSLSELETPPDYLILFNTGAFLTAQGANTIDDLKKLEAKGTKIKTCGTCLNFYELQDKLEVGEVVNMYDITQILTSVSKVINI